MTIRLADSGDGGVLKPCLHDYQVNCGNCRLNSICLPLALESDDIQQLDEGRISAEEFGGRIRVESRLGQPRQQREP